MKYPRFVSKEDWCIKTDFMGLSKEKVIYEKGHIFEPTEDGKYEVLDPYGAYQVIDEKTMREFKTSFDSDEPFFDIVREEVEELDIIIEEIPDDDDILVRNWRIQLDVKTTRKKLKEVERVINEHVKPILNT